MKTIFSSIMLLLVLTSCAQPKLEIGRGYFNKGDYYAARDQFTDCVTTTGNPACMTFLGVVYLKLGDPVACVRWYTLAARYGDPTAILNLTSSGLPVPAADLKVEKDTSGDNAFLTGFLQGMSTNQAHSTTTDSSPKTITCQNGYIPGQVTCNSR